MTRPLLALCLGVLAACAGDETPPDAPPPDEAFDAVAAAIPYRLDQPDAAFALPDVLQEVSGLTPFGDDRLLAVQDEDGLLYVLDRETGAILAEVPFADSGDYEGVEAVGDAVWVLESDGTLYEVAGLAEGRPVAVVHETPVPGGCDAEGLGHDPSAGRLLVACKDEPGPELPDARAIYAFSLQTRQLSERPAFLLDRTRLDADSRSFKPSALAVHPRTGDVYVLSAVRRALAVLHPDGTLAAALALPAQLYVQPEALAFFPDGTLVIASEGGGAAATLLRFSEVTP
ncbi:MAG: SdiA-regulated domain-containing protein [Rubricoccaceae bacterium]|nr:SdiA-regulated domain-containing protein [Rubricoccaceae bacterium]